MNEPDARGKHAPAGPPFVMPAIIDLRECKRVFMRLPAAHPLRIAFQNEPDFLPAREALAKFEVWIRLLYAGY